MPVKVKFVPDKVAGPVTEYVPPVGFAVTLMAVLLQYRPLAFRTGVPDIFTSTFVAPHM